MILKKLTKDNFPRLAGKNLYCYEKSVTYLKELCETYEISESIISILDRNERNHGGVCVAGKNFIVEAPENMLKNSRQKNVIIITSDYYREAFEAICQWENLEKHVEAVYYFANRETEIEEKYRSKYAEQPLRNVIVFRSGPHASSYVKGMDFADNARALFEYMLRIGLNQKYELVWIVKNPEEFSGYTDIPNVSFVSFDWSVSSVKKECDAYYKALCLAKYIFFTDAYGFARNARNDQIRVQLWHGCGFKMRVNPVRCEKRYEYNTVTSELYANIHSRIFGIREDQLLITGLAKQDWVFCPAEKETFLSLGIPEASKYILWLPTFRTTEEKLSQLNEYALDSDTGLPVLQTKDQLRGLDEVLKDKDAVLLIKLHPFQNKEDIECRGFERVVLIDNEKLLEADIQVNQLMGWADGLISDYSSAVIDYLLLDRPVAFLLEDMEDYRNSRGFVYDNLRDWLPGEEIYTYEEYVEFVESVLEGDDLQGEKRRRITREMNRFKDDKNSQRIIEQLNIL